MLLFSSYSGAAAEELHEYSLAVYALTTHRLQLMFVVTCVLICCHAHTARKVSYFTYAQAVSVTSIHCMP